MYNQPAEPGPLNVTQGLTQYQIAQDQDTHNEESRLFWEILAVERIIIQKIVAAVGQNYLKALRDPVTNKITRTIPDILTHLFNVYGHITPTEL